MLSLMMNQPLMISSLIRHADKNHGDTEIVSRTVEGATHRYSYAEAERRSRQLAKALRRIGIAPGDRVGTLAWNTYRHFELYYAISGSGAVCHTINPRLFDEQIVYIVNHARDRLLFVDIRGSCPAQPFNQLLSAFGWPATRLIFQLARQAVLLAEEQFRLAAVHG
jgi:fatty-acyl-CoA synthase